MKIAGWICLILGVAGLLGSILVGRSSAFGSLFWLGLGLFLLHRVREKESKREERQNKSNYEPEERIQIQETTPCNIQEVEQTSEQISSHQLENLEDIQSQLTLQQREAAMCLIAFFGGYDEHMMDHVPIYIFKQSALFFGLPDSPLALSKIMSKYTDADALIDIVLTIKPIKAKEFLLLTCYDLIKSTNKLEAYDLLFNIANDMGYDKVKLVNLINLYQ